MRFTEPESEAEQPVWPAEAVPAARDGAKKGLEARRLIERRMELKRLREILGEPDFVDLE